MRSRPSCYWCRRSKVRCSHHDGENPCRLCLRAGRSRDQCVLEELIPKSRSARRQAARAAASHVASPEVPDVPAVTATTNAAPQASSARSHSYSYTNEPVFCDVPDHIVTEAVEIFARKFPEFSFIHIADFLDQLRTSQRRSLVIKLAAIFALCARFIPSISSEYNNWNATSQDFATFVQQNLWPQIVQEPEIEMVHCLLLIAQYEWGEGNSFSAWMYTGMAIRMFQGLQAASDTALTSQGHASKTTQLRKMVWKREIQRRTIWACFIMDRTMSCGKDRPSSLDITAMKIHLPASEDDFDLGITPSESITYNQLIDLNSTDINGRLTIADYYTITIRSLDIWSHTCKWMADGGRRQVSALGACPWESGSTWYQIQTELDQWRDMLHVRLKYPETPLCIYVHRRQGERFAFVNLIYYLTVLILYREYIPFIPSDRLGLRGPVEPPLLVREAPPGWWSEYSAILFNAAAQISTLLAEMKAANIPFMTPIVGYSAFSAASMNVYLAAFPWVHPNSSERICAAELSRQDLEYLGDFAKLWPLGNAWLQVAQQIQKMYSQVKSRNDYSQHQSHIIYLRKTIEQYGSFPVSNSDDVDDQRGDVDTSALEPHFYPTNTHDNAGNNFVQPHGETAMDSYHQLMYSDGLGGGPPENSGSIFINDWSTWGIEYFTGQQVADTFQSV